MTSYDLLHFLPAAALAGLVRDGAAVAASPARADILALKTHHLYRFPAPALAGIVLASFARAIRPAPAEDRLVLLDRQKVHGDQVTPTLAFPRLFRDRVARAVVLAVAHIIDLTLVRRDDQNCRYEECNNRQQNEHLFHDRSLLQFLQNIAIQISDVNRVY